MKTGNDMLKNLRRKTPKTLLAAVLLLAVLLFGGSFEKGEARVYIDIDSPLFQKFPLALTEFTSLEGGQALSKGQMTWFAEEIARLLDYTGYFNIVSRRVLPESEDKPFANVHRLSEWRAIGVEYLIKAAFQMIGPSLVAEFRLFDTVKGEMLMGRRYTGRLEDRRVMAQRFTNEILLVLTGERGIFDSKISFIIKENRSSDVAVINFDGSDFAKLTEMKSLTLAPKWSPDGRHLAFTSWRDGNPDLYLLDLKTREIRKLSQNRGLNLAGSFSLDGKRILLTLSSDGNEEIYSLNLENRQTVRLTNHFAIDVSPVFSPDGRQIAFVSNRAGSPQIYLMGADGGGVRRLTFEGNYNTSPSWSPKGNRIAYEGMVEGRFQIFTIDEAGLNLTQLTNDKSSNENPSWSPDGKYLVFSSRKNGRSRIMVMNANGTNARVLYEGAENSISPIWSPQPK